MEATFPPAVPAGCVFSLTYLLHNLILVDRKGNDASSFRFAPLIFEMEPNLFFSMFFTSTIAL